jgi:hypothetical protein
MSRGPRLFPIGDKRREQGYRSYDKTNERSE